jgi:hypothetical protein
VTIKSVQTHTPTCSIWAIPDEQIVPGGSTALSWSTTNASSASLDNGIGAVSLEGTRTVSNLWDDTIFTMNVSGQGGTAQCSVPVFLKETTPKPPKKPTCDIHMGGKNEYGAEETITWNTDEDVDSVEIEGAGEVPKHGWRGIMKLDKQTTFKMKVKKGTQVTECSCVGNPIEDKSADWTSWSNQGWQHSTWY